MAQFEVSYEFTMVQKVYVEADNRTQALAKVRAGLYDPEDATADSTGGTSRKWKATRLDE